MQSQSSKLKRHGDDRQMIKARTEFLNTKSYEKLADELAEIVVKYSLDNTNLLDAGCGDCYYTEKIYNSFLEHSKNVNIIGIDISKDALIASSKRCKSIKTAVASVFSLPVRDKSCDIVLNIFSPFAPEEYKRVLKNNGVLVRVIPLKRHLIELKEQIYDNAYENPYEKAEAEGFKLAESKNLEYKINLSGNQNIENLFKMTPYYYKTSRKDQQKLENIDNLEITCQFQIRIYKSI